MHCPLPLTHFQVKPGGDVYLCCEDWLPTSVGNLLRQSPREIWQSPAAVAIRKSVDDGSFRHCTRCPFLPGPAGPVRLEVTPPREHPSVLVLDYDRSCNLACPSCRNSKIALRLEDPRVSRVHQAVIDSRLLDVVSLLRVTGSGDPLGSPTFFDFLRHLPSLTHNQNLRVSLQTNALLLDARRWEILGETSRLVTEVGISIDAATEATYLENRGGSWQTLWQNIRHLNLVREQQPIELHTYFVLQANNYLDLPQFVTLSFDAARADWVHVFHLRNWGTFTDDEYRRRAVHLPTHPEHRLFLHVMQDPRVRHPRVELPTLRTKE
jgi:radical SAM protein with 4Fe4S-binding SPASM domain